MPVEAVVERPVGDVDRERGELRGGGGEPGEAEPVAGAVAGGAAGDGMSGHRRSVAAPRRMHIGRAGGSRPGQAADLGRTGYRPTGRCAAAAREVASPGMRPQTPPVLDLALAGVLLALGAVSALTGETALPRALTLALTAGYTLPLAFRRRAPLTTAALSMGCVLLFAAVDPDNSQPTLPLALALAAYTIGAEVELPRSAVAAAAGLSVFLAALLASDAPAGDAVFACVLYGAPYLSGALLRRRTAGHEEREQRAVEAERARLARELHDVVSHSISVVALQSQAVRRRLEPHQRAEADDLRAVEVTARQAMAEMRRLFGVLRKDGEPMPLAPQPGLGQLPKLIDGTRAAGLEVELRIEGEPAPVPPGVDLAAYRIVQEALTNAVRHAGPARAQVLVRYAPERLELRVDDDGRGVNGHGIAAGGHGLVGMRERVALYEGELEVGNGERGGFRVHATLPVREGAA